MEKTFLVFTAFFIDLMQNFVITTLYLQGFKNMKKLALTSLLFSALALNSAFAAGKVEAPKKEFQEIEANLRKNNPDIPSIKSVRTTPVQGVYEVLLNDADIVYSDKDGKYLFFGNMIRSDNGQKVNLTEERIQELTTVDIKTLPLADAIQHKIGNGKGTVVTFEDPNCPYCKKLHPELAKLNNVTVYTFVVPILGERSLVAAKAIMCAKDKFKAWDEYSKSNTMPSGDQCDTSVLDRNVALSRKLRVAGTPAIFFENGRSLKGFAPAEKLVETMNQPSLKK
jgi:thiol:disulfide interchange protein DsbC